MSTGQRELRKRDAHTPGIQPMQRVRARARRSLSATAARSATRRATPRLSARSAASAYDVDYDYELRRQGHFKEMPDGERPRNIWHFEELLPILDARAQARVGQLSGYTPLISADRLGAELGLEPVSEGRLHLAAQPLLQGPRRVDVHRAAARDGARRDRLRLDGQRGDRVAALAAKAGVDAYVFYPNRLETTKARACMALGAKVCQVEGNYDEANRRCREVAEASGHGVREHHAAPLLRRGREDGRVRDRRAAGLAFARAHRDPGRRRHALLAHAQGTAASCSCWGSPRPSARRSTSPSRAAATRSPSAILAEEARGRTRDARDRRALAGDRRARRRLSGDRRGPQTRRHGGVRLSDPRDLRGHRPAGGDRGPADRAGRRDDGRGAREARRRGDASTPTRPSWR